MKKIILHGPSVCNNGDYVDAGETIEVGDAANQIGRDRAKELVSSHRASEIAADPTSDIAKPQRPGASH